MPIKIINVIVFLILLQCLISPLLGSKSSILMKLWMGWLFFVYSEAGCCIYSFFHYCGDKSDFIVMGALAINK